MQHSEVPPGEFGPLRLIDMAIGLAGELVASAVDEHLAMKKNRLQLRLPGMTPAEAFGILQRGGAPTGALPAQRGAPGHSGYYKDACRRVTESAAKAVLGELRADVELATASVERLLREALCRIRLTAR